MAPSSSRTMYTSLANVAYSYVGPAAVALLAGIVGENNSYAAAAFAFGAVMAAGYFAHFKMFEGYEETGEEELARLEERRVRENGISGRCSEFGDHALEYWLSQGTREISSPCLVSKALNLLKEYDSTNGTDLYQTLKIYLMVERNATMTSQILNIHRSTLPHRLNRISELTGVDLEHFKTRLYLIMSFALEEMT